MRIKQSSTKIWRRMDEGAKDNALRIYIIFAYLLLVSWEISLSDLPEKQKLDYIKVYV